MATLNDLLAQKANLDRQIAEAQRAERGDAVARVKALMAEYGLTLADLGPRAIAAPRRAVGGNSGKKVAPKYRDPATGKTWSGRGLKPTWLAAALNAGKSLTDFSI